MSLPLFFNVIKTLFVLLLSYLLIISSEITVESVIIW